MEAKTSKRVFYNRLANVLIICGILALAVYIWVNHVGEIYHAIYSMYYDKHAADGIDSNEDFFSFEDLPSFLTIGNKLVPDKKIEITVESENPDEVDDGADDIDALLEDLTLAERNADNESNNDFENAAQPEGYPEINYSTRDEYKDGDMVLSVARMGIKSKVMNGTTSTKLKNGPGLYEISDLPTKQNGRVIIAAHRDIYGSWFYSIDKMKSGDRIQILFGDYVFIYQYVKTEIVEKNDWSAIKKQDYTVLYLTSCHPKRTSNQRIIVTAEYIGITKR